MAPLCFEHLQLVMQRQWRSLWWRLWTICSRGFNGPRPTTLRNRLLTTLQVVLTLHHIPCLSSMGKASWWVVQVSIGSIR